MNGSEINMISREHIDRFEPYLVIHKGTLAHKFVYKFEKV